MTEDQNTQDPKLSTWLALADGGGVLVRDSDSSPVPHPQHHQRWRPLRCLSSALVDNESRMR